MLRRLPVVALTTATGAAIGWLLPDHPHVPHQWNHLVGALGGLVVGLILDFVFLRQTRTMRPQGKPVAANPSPSSAKDGNP